MSWKATKLLLNVTNAVEALCGVRGGELGTRTRAEADEIFRAGGIEPASDHSHPPLRRLPVSGTERTGTSTWESVARGGSIETDWLNGEIVLLARRLAMPAPVNTLLQRAMWDLSRSGAPPGSMDEAALLASLA